MTVTSDHAVIIGSGFPSLAGADEGSTVVTRFGRPSAPIHTAELEGHSLLSLARHGDDHSIPPHKINYRANLVALKELGARFVIALNTVGVVSRIRESGEIGIPDQVIDYTWGRAHTIYDGSDGAVEHVDFTDPFTSSLRDGLLAAARAANVECSDGGVYAAMQGPRLESAAEVDRLDTQVDVDVA